MSFHSRRTLDTNSKIIYPDNRGRCEEREDGRDGAGSVCKIASWSFFSCTPHILTTAMNTVEEICMRIVDGEPVIYEEITPSYTVMTEAGYS